MLRLLAIVAVGYLATLVFDELTRDRIRPRRPGPRRRGFEMVPVPVAVFDGKFSLN